MKKFNILLILCAIIFHKCKYQEKENYDSFTKEVSDIKIKTIVHDSNKAAEFDEKYRLALSLQDFGKVLSMQLKSINIDTSLFLGDESFLLFSNANGESNRTLAFSNDTLNKQQFILWYQAQNFKDEKFYYLLNGNLFERDYHFSLIRKYPSEIELDAHCVEDIDNGYFYSAKTNTITKNINGENTRIIDFIIYRINKQTLEEETLFNVSELVQDSMLVPELFEGSDSSPLYDELDIYHWNWLQIDGDKMYINYAFCGMQQVDLKTKKVDWHWGWTKNTFNKVTGIGDLTGPYYTHHFNKITSGPYKGMFSYFENGSYDFDGKEYKPARARIFEYNTKTNSINIVWEKKYDFVSLAMGSINVFDEYISVNVGLSYPLKEMYEINLKNGSKEAFSYYDNLKRPLVYLYDSKGNPIVEYIYPTGFFSYIAAPIKKGKLKFNE